jgi:DNA/RNA-binding domain of Phe-tRNA-synthetase-like protein
MIQVSIDPRILAACPECRIGLISATVVNEPTCDELWAEIEAAAEDIKQRYELLEINQRPAIAGTRHLYKALGKDPSRYRVSSEALCRRIIRGLGIYRLTTLIDVVNLVSIKSGYAISGLDGDRIEGNTLTMSVGRADDVYNGIGRGLLNIEGMPVYRDAMGPIATPTSDEERTKFTDQTVKAQININAFAPEMPLEEAVDWMAALLKKYAHATDVETMIFDPSASGNV